MDWSYAVPSGPGQSLGRAVLSLRSGRKLILQSISFVRFGMTEDRSESYRSIVEALVQRLPAANHGWRFWSDHDPALGFLAGGAERMGHRAGRGLLLSAASYLALAVVYVPLGWRVVAAGRSRRADPLHLPRTLFTAE